jgi:tRNA threonylcarbamoyladenosine biosynthesis protein TsaB
VRPQVLSIDTTSEFGSLALTAGGATVDELPLHAPEGFGHILFEHLARMLARHGWKVGDLDCFAAASGPGSFTGVRVGLSAAKGLAEAAGKPVVAVSNLAAIASFGTFPQRAVLIDARRGEVYGGVYNAALDAVQPEVVAPVAIWLASIPPGEVEFLSTDFSPFARALEATTGRRALMTQAPRSLAAGIGRIATARLAMGHAQDPAAIDANYVRHSDAERFWRDTAS